MRSDEVAAELRKRILSWPKARGKGAQSRALSDIAFQIEELIAAVRREESEWFALSAVEHLSRISGADIALLGRRIAGSVVHA